MSNDNSASGYLTDSFEGISQTFTDVEIISTSDVNVVARAKRYGRWWLLKGLRREVAHEAGYQQRLRKELEILMSLQHPFIVATYGMEEVEDLGRCIVMEYVDGITLKEWLQGKTERKERRRVALELTEAVAYTHSKGIAHRDLKPENIIITRNGANVKLIDFGLADTDSYAILKQPAGTLEYMSPEQAQTSVADSRNDIYSLGMIFDGMDIGCRKVIRKCLLPIERRYQHLSELQHDLTSLEGRSVRITIGIMTVLMVGMIVFMGWQWHQNRQQEKLLTKQAEERSLWAAKFQKEQTEQRQQLTLVHDSMGVILADKERVRVKKKQEEQRRLRVKEAISKGYLVIDKANSQSGMDQFLDTLSNIRYLYTDYSQKLSAIYKAINGYWNRINKDFSDTEMTEIKNAMRKHYEKQAEQWNNKIGQLGK